jgi:hypothetical protein
MERENKGEWLGWRSKRRSTCEGLVDFEYLNMCFPLSRLDAPKVYFGEALYNKITRRRSDPYLACRFKGKKKKSVSESSEKIAEQEK